MSIAIAFLVGFICGGCYLVSCIWPYLTAAIEFFKVTKAHETIHTGWTEKDGQRSFAEFMSGNSPEKYAAMREIARCDRERTFRGVR